MPVHLDARPAAPPHARALTPRRGPVPLAPLLVLQRTAGNRAVASLLARGATGAPLLQRCTGACCAGAAEDQHYGIDAYVGKTVDFNKSQTTRTVNLVAHKRITADGVILTGMA